MMGLIHYSLLFLLGSASGNQAWINPPSANGGAWTEAKVSSPAKQPLISLESTNANVGIPLPEPPPAPVAQQTKASGHPMRTANAKEPLCPNPCQHTCIACQNIPCSRDPDHPCKPKYLLNGQDVTYLCMLAEVHESQKKQSSPIKPAEKPLLEKTPEQPVLASAPSTDPSVSFLVNNLLTTMSEIVAADQKANAAASSQLASGTSTKINSAESTEVFNTGSVSVGSPSPASSHFSSVLSSSSTAVGQPSTALAASSPSSSSSSTAVRSSTSASGSSSSSSGTAASSVGNQAGSQGTVVVINQDEENLPFPFFQMYPPWYLQQQQLHQLRQQQLQQQMLQQQLQQQQLQQQQQQQQQQRATTQNRVMHHIVQPINQNSVFHSRSQANSAIHPGSQVNTAFHPLSQVDPVFHAQSQANSVFHPQSQVNTAFHPMPQVNTMFHPVSQVNSVFHPRTQVNSPFFPRSQAMAIQTNVIRLPSTFAKLPDQIFTNTHRATDVLSRLHPDRRQIYNFDDSVSVINHLPSFIL